MLTANIADDPCLAHTASILGLRHQDVLCDSIPNVATRRQKKDKDLVVDCAALADRLHI